MGFCKQTCRRSVRTNSNLRHDATSPPYKNEFTNACLQKYVTHINCTSFLSIHTLVRNLLKVVSTRIRARGCLSRVPRRRRCGSPLQNARTLYSTGLKGKPDSFTTGRPFFKDAWCPGDVMRKKILLCPFTNFPGLRNAEKKSGVKHGAFHTKQGTATTMFNFLVEISRVSVDIEYAGLRTEMYI